MESKHQTNFMCDFINFDNKKRDDDDDGSWKRKLLNI